MFSETEILFVAKSYMKKSNDKMKGNEKKGSKFWKEIHSSYLQLVAVYNKHHGDRLGKHFSPLPSRTQKSINDQWSGSIQPAINKFTGICASNKPT